MRAIPLLPIALFSISALLTGCGGYGRVGLEEAPKVVNVSSYDPKERQRAGDSFSSSNVSALRKNGALGLIARAGKGRNLDDKCADFLAAADRQGMKLGTYYFVLSGIDPVWQADQYINRLHQIAATRNLKHREILLVGDFDTRSRPADLVAFINRIEQRTGKLPVVYLENSAQLRAVLSSASPEEKRRIRQCPYWLALYSHESGFRTPDRLRKAYGIWDGWAMWQYAGVEWEGRSVPKVYHHGPWKSPRYFGTMDRPMEHNAFNGSVKELQQFWSAHSLQVR
jgi:GH25 family lysozyme M1 (1,4-beta-N-acetylmuramidase)